MKKSKFYTFKGYELLNRETKELTPSMEDYLEMIYRINLLNEPIRMHDLAEKLNVRTSSTTKIVQKLSKQGMVKYEKYGFIELTTKGEEIGHFLLYRHMVLEKFLETISGESNLKDIELLEHYVSPSLLEKIELFNEFIENHKEVKKQFYEYVKKHEIE